MDKTIITWILTALTQLAAGCASGYITNTWAVKWLFKPIFGRLDVSILSTKEKRELFTESIARCVDENILTKETLEKEIGSDKFKRHIGEMADDFIENSLIRDIGELTPEEIEEFEPVIDNVKKTVVEYSERAVGEIFDALFERQEFKAEFYELTAPAVEYFIASAMRNMDKESLEKAIDGCDMPVGKFISEEFLKTAVHEIFGNKLEEIIDKAVLTAEPRLEKIKADNDTKPLSTFIKDKNELARRINDFLIRYMTSDNWAEVEKAVLSALKESDKSIYELLSLCLRDEPEKLISEYIPQIVPPLVEFIEKNRAEINHMIDDAVEHTCDKSAGIKKLAFAMINVPNQLISFVKKLETESTESIAQNLTEFLKNTTVSELIIKLSDKGISKEKVHGIITHLFEKYGAGSIQMLLDYVLKKTPYDISAELGIDVQSMRNSLVKNRSRIEELAYTSLCAQLRKPVSDVMKITGINADKLTPLLENNAQNVNDKAKDLIYSYVSNNGDSVKDGISAAVGTKVNDVATSVKKSGFEKIINKLKENKVIRRLISKRLPEAVSGGIIKRIGGGVRRIVTNALNRFSIDELYKAADAMMGGSLKYLSYLGAVMGIIVSAIMLPFTVRGASITGTPSGVFSLLLMLAITGGIGVITNVAAIFFLFHPHKKFKFLEKTRLLNCFSQGYIMKKKDTLSTEMGKLVENDWITSDSIMSMADNKQLAKIVPTAVVSLLDNNKYTVSEKVSEYAVKAARNGKEWLTEKEIAFFVDEKRADKLIDVVYEKAKSFDYGKYFDRNTSLSFFINEEKNSDIRLDTETVGKIYDILMKITITPEMTAILKSSLVEKADGKSESDIKRTLSEIAGKALSKRFESSETIGDILGDDIKSKIRALIKKLFPKLEAAIVAKAAEFIEEKQNDSNPIMRGMIATVSDTLDYLKDISIPEYIHSKSEEIESLLSGFIENKIYTADKSVIRNADMNIAAVVPADKLGKIVRELILSLIGLFENARIGDAAYIFGIESAEALRENTDEGLIGELSEVFAEMLGNSIGSAVSSVMDIPLGICDGAYAELIGKNKALGNMIRLTGKNIYRELCDCEITIDVLIGNNGDRIIDRWIDASEEKIRRISAEAALDIVEGFVNDERSKDAVKKAFTLTAPAVLGSIGKYLDKTIEDMELGILTKEKIDSLDAYDIEKLVRSFADKVFHKLYALGAAGVVFGINTYATIVIAVYYLIKEKKKK